MNKIKIKFPQDSEERIIPEKFQADTIKMFEESADEKIVKEVSNFFDEYKKQFLISFNKYCDLTSEIEDMFKEFNERMDTKRDPKGDSTIFANKLVMRSETMKSHYKVLEPFIVFSTLVYKEIKVIEKDYNSMNKRIDKLIEIFYNAFKDKE